MLLRRWESTPRSAFGVPKALAVRYAGALRISRRNSFMSLFVWITNSVHIMAGGFLAIFFMTGNKKLKVKIEIDTKSYITDLR